MRKKKRANVRPNSSARQQAYLDWTLLTNASVPDEETGSDDHPGGQRLKVVHPLRDELNAVFGAEQTIGGQCFASQFIDRSIEDNNAQLILPGMSVWHQVDAEGRAPDVARELPIDEDFSGLADWAVEIGAHVGLGQRVGI